MVLQPPQISKAIKDMWSLFETSLLFEFPSFTLWGRRRPIFGVVFMHHVDDPIQQLLYQIGRISFG